MKHPVATAPGSVKLSSGLNSEMEVSGLDPVATISPRGLARVATPARPGSVNETVFQHSLIRFIQLTKSVEDQVGVAERLNCDWKLFGGFLKLKHADGYFHNLPKARFGGHAG